MSNDLISIVNQGLADKLEQQIQIKEQTDEAQSEGKPQTTKRSFKQDIWRAVFALNLIRYAFAVILLTLIALPNYLPELALLDYLKHPQLFLGGAVVLLLSAITFSYISKYKEVSFNTLVTVQFSLDAVLATLMTCCAGSLNSGFALIYFIVVATGSVVLPRRMALGLAAGIFILMFCEYFYSFWLSDSLLSPNYPQLSRYGVSLLATGLVISYLAERIRLTELRKYVPGNEKIEEYLVRQEVNALKKALATTNGNKTAAAKLLGMSFRSFRYKLTKYGIQ